MHVFGSRSENDRKLFRLLAAGLYFFLAAWYAASLAGHDADLAKRQRTSFGMIEHCERQGRGGIDNFCHYTFPVDGEQYEGFNEAPSGLQPDQTVVVYYDDRNPAVSSLEEYSHKSSKDTLFAYIFLSALVGITPFLIWRVLPTSQN